MSLLLALALLAQIEGELRVLKVTLAESTVGPARTEMKVHPMERVVLRFEIEGLKTDAKGDRRMSFAYGIADADGKALSSEFKGRMEAADVTPPSPGYAFCSFRLKNPAVKGPVKVSLSAVDEVSGKQVKKDVEIAVGPAEASIVGVRFADPKGEVPRSPVFAPGEPAFLHYEIVSLATKDKGVWYQQDVEVLDAATNARVYFKEKVFDYKSEKAEANAQYLLTCGRAGKYVCRILGRDMNDGGRKIERSVAFEVREP